MSRIATFLLALMLPASSIHASEPSEITIEKRPFVIRHSFTAAVMPDQATLLKQDAATWEDFEITRIVPHGSRVSKGDVLVAFATEEIDRKLHDVRKELETRAIGIEQARLELTHLENTAPHRMDAMERSAAEAKEENAYFINTRRKTSEETAGQELKRAEFSLENEREELRQLEKMYAADDLTEETEEIILERQKHMVSGADFELRVQKLAHERTREVLLPREAIKLAEAERDTAITFAKFMQESPRAIARAKLELETLETASSRDKETLAKLEADRKQFEFTAASDGWFYHGVIDHGRWITEEADKTLVPHGKPASGKPFATFIPIDATMNLAASLAGDVASQLGKDAVGVAWIAGREDMELPIKLLDINPAPGLEGKFAARFSAEWPDKLEPAPASSVNIELVVYEAPAALVLPAKALELGSSGWSVAVKLADGKTERRPVKRGRLFHDECEILTGLDAGQVVVVP